MAPSIRVSEEVYNGLRKMIEASYANTISTVIERFLREEGVIPMESNTFDRTAFEEQEKNEGERIGSSSFSETDESEFRNILGEEIPRYRYQRAAMRDVYSKYNGDKEKVIKAYAWMEEKGYAPRGSNIHNFSSMYYAEAFYNDGVKKGWLRESDS